MNRPGECHHDGPRFKEGSPLHPAPLLRSDERAIDEPPAGAGAVFVDPHQHSRLVLAGFEMREGTRIEIGTNAAAACIRVDGLDALGQRPRRSRSLPSPKTWAEAKALRLRANRWVRGECKDLRHDRPLGLARRG